MAMWKSWLIARKDLLVMWRRKSPLVLLIGLPIVLGTALPLLIHILILRKGFSLLQDPDLISAFGFFFMIIGALLPLYISSYSIVGEKLEKSMEPLLATPTTDGEILMGKYIGTLLPTLLSVYAGAIVYMVLIDAFTRTDFGYFFFPNWAFDIILFVGVPTAATYAITLSVFISSKVNSVMAAYQGGGVTLIPFLIIYVMGEIGVIKLDDTTDVLIISLALLFVAVIMYFISRATFSREKILTEWK